MFFKNDEQIKDLRHEDCLSVRISRRHQENTYFFLGRPVMTGLSLGGNGKWRLLIGLLLDCFYDQSLFGLMSDHLGCISVYLTANPL